MKHEDFLRELRQDPEYIAAEAELKPILDIADAVLRLRLAKGWSQAELARRVGTKQANISKLENGLANPTVDFLRRVAKALETDFNVHFGPQALNETQAVIRVEIRTVQPEKLWGSQRPQAHTKNRWPDFAAVPSCTTPADPYQAA
jgi:transcriptional regulator with XRE-family HTH domain